MWADDFWVTPHRKENVEQTLRDLDEEASRRDLEPKPASLWWTSTYDSEEKSDVNLGSTSGCYTYPFEENFQDFGLCNESPKDNVRCCGRTNAVDTQSLLEGDTDIQKQRCSVEDKVSKTGGPRLCSLGVSKRKMVVEHTNDETKTMIRLFRFKRNKDETWVAYHTRTCEMAKNIWTQVGLPFLYEIIPESMWRAMEWVCDENSNTVINSP